MRLSEAIIHCEEVADRCAVTDGNAKCEMEHRQLAEWLKELQQRRKESEWIPCNKMMPKEQEWVGTKKFGTTISDEVYVTFETPDGQRFADHTSFQNGNLSPMDKKLMDIIYKGAKPIAWMPLPEPYQGDK